MTTSFIIEKQVSENLGKPGYWKQKLACQFSHRCKISLKEAWKTVNFYIVDKALCDNLKKNPAVWIGEIETININYNLKKGTYYGD